MQEKSTRYIETKQWSFLDVVFTYTANKMPINQYAMLHQIITNQTLLKLLQITD